MTYALKENIKRLSGFVAAVLLPPVVAIVLVALALAGCAQSPGGLNTAEGEVLSKAVSLVVPANVNAKVANNLAVLSGGNVQVACGVIQVAQGYFDNVKPKVTTKALQVEATAEKVVADICNNPPTDTTSAIATLFKEWAVIQAATTVPKAST